MQKFGNWGINDQGIIWLKTPAYLIPVHSLSEEGHGRRKGMYDILLHMTEKSWLTRNDLYILNTAFLYSLEHFGIGLSEKISITKTFLEQEKLMDKNEHTQPDEIMLGGGD
jgi:hypothetical protein